ncbi:pantothenate kinase [Helicobacter pylori]|uniref:pantothenate kinase n=1 Tax=Helicobacter pylori TaxID=210 RepID=UPI001FCFFE03|nr:pantothenate kinase [Helicobacter pylori]UOR27144.1 pantothenate kinase [Helicobacter pylori]
MSGLKTFSCVVVLCGAMANTAIADPRIEARGQLGREIGDKVEDFIRGVDREPQTREPQAPREPIRDFYDYGYSFGHAW